MDCDKHGSHSHTHGSGCGHPIISHDNNRDYLHSGHLHRKHGDHYDEHSIPVSKENPEDCIPLTCSGDHDPKMKIPHGDHVDYIVEGRLHHRHGDHCDDHGPIILLVN